VNLRIALFLSLVFLASVPLFPQTAQRVENLLNERAVNWSSAAAFVLEAADAGAFGNPEEAFRFAAERKWLPKKAAPEAIARLDGVSLLLARSFGTKGGIMYSLTKSRRYAYRELVYQNVIQGRSDPAMTVSGEELLFLIGRMLSMREAEEKAPRERPAGSAVSDQERLLREINAQLTAGGTEDISARITEQGVTINIPDIQFRTNSSELTQDGKNKLEETARILRNVAERDILVAGHTALAGTSAEQQRTSLERARSVASFLVSSGVRRTEEITVRGYGAERPVADNATEQGRIQNRRVEITILTPEAMESLQ